MIKVYPDRYLPALFRFTLDVLAVVWIAFWASAGWLTYQTVMGLEAIADGLRDTGRTFNDWIAAFQGNVPRGIPYISSWLNQQALSLQRHTGDPLISLSGQVRQDIHELALALALAIALPPIVYVVLTYGVWRWRDMREMGAASAFVRVALATRRVEEARALLAYRAVAQLSFRQLMRASRDPVGDIAEHHYERWAAAMLARAGIDPRRLAPRAAPDRMLGSGRTQTEM